MTIDEAIEFYKGYKDRSGGTVDYNEFDEQMVKWLEELKKYKEKPEGYLWDEAVQQGYNKAIDDFAEKLKQDVMAITFGLRICDIDRISRTVKGRWKE